MTPEAWLAVAILTVVLFVGVELWGRFYVDRQPQRGSWRDR